MNIFKRLLNDRETRTRAWIADSIRSVIADEDVRLKGAISSVATIRSLTDEINKLKAEALSLREDNERRERDIEHKVGLARMRMDAEMEIAEERIEALEEKLEAEKDVAVREAKVAAREEAMKASFDVLRDANTRLEKLAETLTKALPSARILTKVTREE